MKPLDRRRFLGALGAAGASLALGRIEAHAQRATGCGPWGLPTDLFILDAHEHPDHFYLPVCGTCDSTSTVDLIRALGMKGSSFAALGDWPAQSTHPEIDFEGLLAQLDYVRALEASGRVTIVRKVSDLRGRPCSGEAVPGAILSVEGAAPLIVGLAPPVDPHAVRERVDILYDYGVRLITLMHHRANGIGDVMTAEPVYGGLTELGRVIVERMVELGMVIDVAHAHIDTLRDTAEIARAHGRPIIDSHTSPSYLDNPYPDPEWSDKPLNLRLRSWAEIELVAETGGLFCTWPLKRSRPGMPSNRETIQDWARESLMLKERLGFRHIGLGTDAGGGLPEVVDGWESILNLVDLAEAMSGVGLKAHEIKAYMGGNLLRVLRRCMG